MPSGTGSGAEALWTIAELEVATGGELDGAARGDVSGVSIDTRTLVRGDLFVALKDQRDGHAFVTAAFEKGAAAALVGTTYSRRPGDGCLLRVADPLEGLRAIAEAARNRMSADGLVIAVTGSAGKTGTTAMLRACLERLGPTHAPEKSFNNHWGVPLTMARMPKNARYAVVEIGMNHAGEIGPLTRLARPHVAIVTNVLPVHVGNFADGEIGVADAKSEIFEGLPVGGIAVLPRDNPHFERLAAAARRCGARIVSFGRSPGSDVCAIDVSLREGGTRVTDASGASWQVGTPGEHIAVNSLAVVAVLKQELARRTGSVSLAEALEPLAEVRPTAGRGRRGHFSLSPVPGAPPVEILLIDESYNANPASMRAALAVLGITPPGRGGRRIAVMGDMLELGEAGPALHVGLADAISAANVDLVFACGSSMRGLFEVVPERCRGSWRATSVELVQPVVAALRDGDVVMIKGSLGTRMAPIVEAIASGGGRS